MAAIEIPIFPLNTVLFPGGLLPLRIFEQRYLEMSKACLKDGSAFGVCLIREGAEVGAPATPEHIGCLARIVQWDMQQLGLLQITARGESRFRILERHVQSDGLARAAVKMLPGDTDAEIPQICLGCVRLLERVIEQQAGLFEAPHRLDSCSWVSARLAEVLPLPLVVKQKLLELDDGLERLEMLHRIVVQQG